MNYFVWFPTYALVIMPFLLCIYTHPTSLFVEYPAIYTRFMLYVLQLVCKINLNSLILGIQFHMISDVNQ